MAGSEFRYQNFSVFMYLCTYVQQCVYAIEIMLYVIHII
jgi:hypothetical protein